MAISFPNYLAAQLIKPDYSGIGDSVSNFYGGKAMKNDDLIKRVAAQFAQPNAEMSLEQMKQQIANEKLSGQKSVLEMQKMRRDQQQEAQLQALLANALNPNAQGGQPQQAPETQQPMPQMRMPQTTQPMPQQLNPNLGKALAPQNPPTESGQGDIYGTDPKMMDARFRKFDQQATGLPSSAYKDNDTVAPSPSAMPKVENKPVTINGVTPEQTPVDFDYHPKEAKKDELVIDEGNPRLAGIDALWDSNPIAREFLKKKGFEKTVKQERDKKTGQEMLYTKYPSGRIVKKTIGQEQKPEDMDGDIPLTKPILNAAVKQVRGNDAVLPYIDDLIKMGGASLDKNGDLVKDDKGNIVRKDNKLPSSSIFPFTYTDAHAGYKRIVDNALEKYMTASGFQQTDKSTMKVEEIMQRAKGESDEHYLEEMAKERKNMLRTRADNIRMITKGLKKYPDFGSESGGVSTSSINESDPAGVGG